MSGDGRSVWHRFGHDPRVAEHQHLRASDRDRDVVTEVLSEGFADGRLDREELDERQDRLRESRTLGDLPPIVADLVSDSAVPAVAPAAAAPAVPGRFRLDAEAAYRQRLVGAVSGFLIPTLICWVVWIAAGGGFPWPLFVTIGTVMGPIGVLASGRERQVAQVERELEEKARREERGLPPAEGD